MHDTQELVPAQDLAATNKAHYPNESAEYRAARNELLIEEIELRRHLERIASQRRALPAGGEIPQDFLLASETGPVRFSSLFGDKHTLVIYSMMYGPQRKAPCPMCTSFLNAWNGVAVNLRQRVALAVTARSPIERLIDYKNQRGLWVRRVHSHLRQPRRRRCPRPQRLQPARWNHPPLLQRRDERSDGRSRTGSARRPGPRSSMANFGLDAGRPRHGLVSEARLLAQE
jgi:hypothetical protein